MSDGERRIGTNPLEQPLPQAVYIPISAVTVEPAEVESGGAFDCTVTFDQAADADRTVSCALSSPAGGRPAVWQVTVPAGATSGAARRNAPPVPADTVVVITATQSDPNGQTESKSTPLKIRKA